MKVVFWGTPEYAVQSLHAIINSEHEVLAVVTQPDKRRGRGKKLIPSPVKIEAFVLMSNHYHLLLYTPDANLDKFMNVLSLIFVFVVTSKSSLAP